METVLSRPSPPVLAPERGKSSQGWPGSHPECGRSWGTRGSAPTVREHSSTRGGKQATSLAALYPPARASLGAADAPRSWGGTRKGLWGWQEFA